MNIEQMTDRNNTSMNRIGVTQMIDLQRALVADHIANLQREGLAIRAERERDHLREHAAAGTEATDHRADLPSPRVRLGRWLVAAGQAISGPRPATLVRDGEPMSASVVAQDNPCDDGHDRLASAA
jgi:hypothetical protein